SVDELKSFMKKDLPEDFDIRKIFGCFKGFLMT
ncbi:unnamed protein product, partial [marine sediment metagenome]